MRPILRALFVPVICLLSVLAISDCGTSPQPAVPIAVDAADFVCNELDQHWQTEPGYVKFACAMVSLIPTASSSSGVSSAPSSTPPPSPVASASAGRTVIVKVLAEDAASFRARHVIVPSPAAH